MNFPSTFGGVVVVAGYNAGWRTSYYMRFLTHSCSHSDHLFFSVILSRIASYSPFCSLQLIALYWCSYFLLFPIWFLSRSRCSLHALAPSAFVYCFSLDTCLEWIKSLHRNIIFSLYTHTNIDDVCVCARSSSTMCTHTVKSNAKNSLIATSRRITRWDERFVCDMLR